MTQLVLNPVAPSEHAPCVFLYSPEGAGSQEVTRNSGEQEAKTVNNWWKKIAEIHRGGEDVKSLLRKFLYIPM